MLVSCKVKRLFILLPQHEKRVFIQVKSEAARTVVKLPSVTFREVSVPAGGFHRNASAVVVITATAKTMFILTLLFFSCLLTRSSYNLL